MFIEYSLLCLPRGAGNYSWADTGRCFRCLIQLLACPPGGFVLHRQNFYKRNHYTAVQEVGAVSRTARMWLNVPEMKKSITTCVCALRETARDVWVGVFVLVLVQLENISAFLSRSSVWWFLFFVFFVTWTMSLRPFSSWLNFLTLNWNRSSQSWQDFTEFF